MKKLFRLVHESARKNAARECLSAPDGYVVRIGPATRSLEQNAKLHAMLTEVAKWLPYQGQKRGPEFWKGLFVSGWQIATGQKVEIVPGLEGEFVNVRVSTTSLTVKEMASLIEYILAYGSSAGIDWSDEARA